MVNFEMHITCEWYVLKYTLSVNGTFWNARYLWMVHFEMHVTFEWYVLKCTLLMNGTLWNGPRREKTCLRGVCKQHRHRPASAYAQSDQRLSYSLFGKNHIEAFFERNYNNLASLCSWGDWLSLAFTQTPKTVFLAMRPKCTLPVNVWPVRCSSVSFLLKSLCRLWGPFLLQSWSQGLLDNDASLLGTTE